MGGIGQHATPTGTEADVRNDICSLLARLGFDEFHLEYRTQAGPVDIYLPRQRTIIETKAQLKGGGWVT